MVREGGKRNTGISWACRQELELKPKLGRECVLTELNHVGISTGSVVKEPERTLSQR